MSVNGISESDLDSIEQVSEDQKIGQLGDRQVVKIYEDRKIEFQTFEKKCAHFSTNFQSPIGMTRCTRLEVDIDYDHPIFGHANVKIRAENDNGQNSSSRDVENDREVDEDRNHPPDSRDRDYDRDRN